ncbi:MAG TPA: hypothetical protein VIA62_18500 [Thermoanaerobaculia bacterium]|jgi:hypothetical protein|nr:hypothetical protein [Thermoanaerobaculia bacterium]
MSKQKSDRNAKDLKEWGHAASAIAANAADLPQAEIPRLALEKLTEELRKLVLDQSLHRANKQEASQRMAEIHSEGAKLATVLRVIAKQHYGNRSEKLVELGIQPLRTRARKAAPGATPPPVASPPAPGPTPVTPATLPTPTTTK